jgi:hypothetical protein
LNGYRFRLLNKLLFASLAPTKLLTKFWTLLLPSKGNKVLIRWVTEFFCLNQNLVCVCANVKVRYTIFFL